MMLGISPEADLANDISQVGGRQAGSAERVDVGVQRPDSTQARDADEFNRLATATKHTPMEGSSEVEMTPLSVQTQPLPNAADRGKQIFAANGDPHLAGARSTAATRLDPRPVSIASDMLSGRMAGHPQIAALQAIHSGAPAATGFGGNVAGRFFSKHLMGHALSHDQKLQRRIAEDPMIMLHQANLSIAIGRLRTVSTAGSPAEIQKAGDDALASAQKLDDVRKGMEATGVFRAGNNFNKNAAIASVTVAGLGISAGATTGGIIAWNNKKQGDNLNS